MVFLPRECRKTTQRGKKEEEKKSAREKKSASLFPLKK
jgi:hypothetical protein